MPNWCTNKLTVQGPRSEINRLKDAVKTVNDEGNEEVFSLGAVYPMPSGLVGTVSPPVDQAVAESNIEKYGAADWYKWHTSRWGTKWDVREATMADVPDAFGIDMCDGNDIVGIVYEFHTAWSPPCDWLEHVATLFPELHFQLDYEELGMGFKGTTLACGDRFKDHCIDLSAALNDDDDDDYEIDPDSYTKGGPSGHW